MLFPKLWQRLFLYCLLLVLLSTGISVLMHHIDFVGRRAHMALVFSGEVRRSLDGQSLDTAKTVSSAFNKHYNKLWIEDAGGALIAGERFDGLSGGERPPRPRDAVKGDGVTLWKTGMREPFFIAEGQVTIGNEQCVFYNAFAEPPRLPLHILLFQWLFTTAIIGGALAFWMARRVSLPLRRLETELSELLRLRTLRNVTVTDNDEIAAVAAAVNRLTDSLRKHVKSMRELVINISHELRSPLARMTLSADMVKQGLFLQPPPQDKGPGPDEAPDRESAMLLAKKHFAALEEELVHMDKVIGSTLLNSKLELQSPETLTTTVDLSHLCLAAANRFAHLFQREELLFSHSIASGILMTGDETLLLQLLSNLLDNACKYTLRPEGRVLLTLSKEDGRAFLTVENSFDPLTPEELERMFEPFCRLDQRTGTGVGLGLSLVQKIAALHRGGVTAVSTDMGIRIRAWFPVTGESPVRTAAPT